MGSIITLPGTVTSSPFGKFHQFEGTFDSTVYLWDAEYAPFTSLPAEFASHPNLMRERAAEVTGLTASQCDFEISNTLGNADPAKASGEITSKKGIHVANPQSGSQVAASTFGLGLNANFANWLLGQTDAGADYAVLVSLWLRCTRELVPGAAAVQSVSHFVSASGATTNLLYFMQPNNVATGSLLVAGNRPPSVAGVSGIANAATQGWQGTKPANMNGASQRALLALGATGSWAGFNYNKAPSYVAYRAQMDLVDLSEVAGADRAAKCAAMMESMSAMATRDFAVGGRFYGDVYTPAATLKP